MGRRNKRDVELAKIFRDACHERFPTVRIGPDVHFIKGGAEVECFIRIGYKDVNKKEYKRNHSKPKESDSGPYEEFIRPV